MSFLKGNKNKKKRILSIVGLIFLIVAVFAGIVLVQENQDIREDAATGCKFITNVKDCKGACGAAKSNGNRFECRWDTKNDKCEETSKKCGGQGQGSVTCSQLGGTCMGQTSGTCTKTMKQTADCGNYAYCCYGATSTTIPSGPTPTTHSSTCRHGDSITQICGAGWVYGQILTPCIKKQTKVCVYGNWEIRVRCGENQPACR